MKKLSLVLWMIFLSIGSVFADDFEKHISQRNKEGDPYYHKARKEWLKSMHRTESGVDYRILKRELQTERLKRKNDLLKNFDKDSPQFQKFISDNGKISGYWKEIGSRNQSGRIHTSDVDLTKSMIYAASAGGNVWRGTLEGKDWTCLNNSIQFNIQSIKVEYVAGNRRIIVFDRSNVYISDNEGGWWRPATGLENVANWGGIRRGVVINDSNKRIMYLLADEWDFDAWKAVNSVYFSTDDGLSFNKIFSVNSSQNIDIWGVERSPGEFISINSQQKRFNKLVCVHRDTIFSIMDSKKEVMNICEELISGNPDYTKLSGSEIDGDVQLHFHVNPPNTDVLKIYRTLDFGENLEFKSQAPTRYFMENSYGTSKLNPDLAFLGGVHCFKTIDGGTNWKKLNDWPDYYGDPLNKLHADIPGIRSFRTSVDKEFFLIATDGGIYITKDDYSVKNISLTDLNVSQYYSIYSNTDDNIIFAGSQDQGFQRSEPTANKTLDFAQLVSGDYGSLTSGDGGQSIWCVYPGFATIYPQATISDKNSGWLFSNSYNDRVWLPPIAAVPNIPFSAYIAAGGSVPDKSKIWSLTYDQLTDKITAIEFPFQFDQQEPENDVSALAISPINTDYIYALTKKGIFYSSTVAGMNWTETAEFIGPEHNYLYGSCIYASKINLGTVYIAGSGYSNAAVYVSEDNGATFEPLDGLPPTFVYQIDMTEDEEVIFAATDDGPYIYIKNHKKWYNIAGLEAPDQSYWTVNYLPTKKTVRFGTYGRGIWDFEIENIITGVEDNTAQKNANLSLYPNPASDFINVSFTGIAGEQATVKIVDIEGKLIYKCFDGILNNSESNITLNLSEIPNIKSGTYLMLMTSKGMVHYEKFIVVK